ncbi:MAG: protein TolQ [Deltaproteobacteria bacterium]|nr:protein TolQ [Deltaproteobacteria bacterium]MBW2340518.1 protein TolQ [Deltaproteobacteria bacterium]
MPYSLQFLGSGVFGTDIVQMVYNAGPMVKFVLLVLLFFSVTSWTIVFMKLRLLKRFREENEEFLELFSSSREIGRVYLETKIFKFSPLAKIFRAGYAEFSRAKALQGNPDDGMGFQSQHPIMENVQRAARKTLSVQGARLEKGLTFLATTGNTCPFIGLFGTVWGIMTSFRAIGMKGSASLGVVAPGIAEALIATAAGLAAAIPAVVAFNYFNRRIRSSQIEMGSFISDFTNLIERGLLKRASSERARGDL